jgi:hypothetical protein
MNILAEDFGEMLNFMILVEAQKKLDNGLLEENYTKFIHHDVCIIMKKKVIFLE